MPCIPGKMGWGELTTTKSAGGGQGVINVFATSQSMGRSWHHKGIVSSAREYYCRVLPKRKTGRRRDARVSGIIRWKAGSEEPGGEISE